MAYNSDGYIMIDFTEVDFRRTNQTIEGLYKRCVDVIGTNKFILVINANGRTPLPATCSFTNNQYVIDTVIYMFAVSSNDNLFIRRNDVPASDIIDDSSISVDKTWSSNKINTELDGKQDTLTPGDNISIVNDVISSNPIKSFTYTGSGDTTNTIKFPSIPLLVLSIDGITSAPYPGCISGLSCPLHQNSERAVLIYRRALSVGQGVVSICNASFNANELTLFFTSSSSPLDVLNDSNTVYTVYYI